MGPSLTMQVQTTPIVGARGRGPTGCTDQLVTQGLSSRVTSWCTADAAWWRGLLNLLGVRVQISYGGFWLISTGSRQGSRVTACPWTKAGNHRRVAGGLDNLGALPTRDHFGLPLHSWFAAGTTCGSLSVDKTGNLALGSWAPVQHAVSVADITILRQFSGRPRRLSTAAQLTWV